VLSARRPVECGATNVALYAVRRLASPTSDILPAERRWPLSILRLGRSISVHIRIWYTAFIDNIYRTSVLAPGRLEVGSEGEI